MTSIAIPARRRFLQQSAALGGGLVIAFHLPGAGRVARAAEAAVKYPPNAFIRIGRDESVTVLVSKLEFGQGVFTSLPMLIAEELECDWTKVRAEHAPVAPVYAHPVFGIQMTGGSQSVASSWDQLRTVGAQARAMLVAAAAKRWNVPPAQCRAAEGVVLHEGSGRRLTYGALADEAMAMPVPAQVALKPKSQWKLLGRPVTRTDGLSKSDGSALFGMDVRQSGLAVAMVERAPVFGATVAGFDAARARTVSGVLDVVQVPSGVAVIAADTWAAKQGRDALEVRWNLPPGTPTSTAALREQYRALARTPGAVAKLVGDPAGALPRAVKSVTAEYELPYLAHAPMEPLNCTVDLSGGRCRIWSGTQFQTIDLMNVAKAAGVDPAQVDITTTLAGGGFGRRATPASDTLVEAVEVAKAAKRPVKVVWTREDDIRGGFYRPMFVHRVTAGIGADGLPLGWDHVAVGQSILTGTPFEPFLVKDGIDGVSVEGAADTPYEIPHLRVTLHSPKNAVPVLWWRSVGHTHTAFVMETMVDELAAAAGQDPVRYRERLLAKHPRHLAALRLAAAKSGWGTALPAGRARGVAVHESFGSVVAHVAEVSMQDGRPRVHKVTSAIHCGTVVNPLGVEAQVQGAVAYGLSAALSGAITLKDGRVEQSNFHDYPVLRLTEMPEVSVHVVPSDDPPTGVGEPGTPPIAPAVANAVAALTGKRLRVLPFGEGA